VAVSEDDAQEWEVAARTAFEVGVTGFGLAIGGPFGALVASAIKPALELVAPSQSD
jgi:hypothetical protein